MEIDEVDRRVLAALLANGRASATEVGDVADVGTTTATWRRQAMEGTGVIRAYEPLIDYAALGYEVAAIIRLEVEPPDSGAVAADVAEDARITTVYETTGPQDVVAVGRFRDRDGLNVVCRDLRADPRIRRLTADTARPIAEHDQFPPTEE